MLCLTRKAGESIKIGDDITIVIIDSRGQVKIGIDAPKDVVILRSELTRRDPVMPSAKLTGGPSGPSG